MTLLLDMPAVHNLPPDPTPEASTAIRNPAQSVAFEDVESRYLSAKDRLIAAQDEKAEAIAEFLRARDALRGYLEEVWPDRDEMPGM